MNRTSIAGAIALSTIGFAVVAHNGATGVVLDRMNGMSAMRDVMRDLAPMMQGQVPYDMRVVQNGAATLMSHAGETMNLLFPEEPIPAASYANPRIWEQWAVFTALSEDLRANATGLALAAPNGLTAPAPPAADPMADMDMSGMQMAPAPGAAPAPAPVPEGFTTAELMGMVTPFVPVAPVVGAAPGAQSDPVAALIRSIDYSTMAAPTVFEQVGQTCAACHAQFRNGG